MGKDVSVDVEQIADLAYITLSKKEINMFQSEINSILTYVEQLSELDVDGVEPTMYAMPLENVLRDDKTCQFQKNTEILDNAPELDDNLFVVPVVIDQEDKT